MTTSSITISTFSASPGKIVVNLYLTRVIPSEYLKVYLLSIGSPKLRLIKKFKINNKKLSNYKQKLTRG